MSHEHELGRGSVYVPPQGPTAVLRRLQFDSFFNEYRGIPFAVRTMDGWFWSSSSYHEPRLIVTFSTSQVLEAVISEPTEAALGHMFLDGNLDVYGDVPSLVSVAQYTLHHSQGLSRNLTRAIGRFCMEFHHRIRVGARSPAAPNWHCCPCPMDLPVGFFECWLGPLLAHSCAMATASSDDFQHAQIAALQKACESLELERGDRLLDLGCGWGSLLLHATKCCGAETHGVTFIREQAEAIAHRLHERGLRPELIVQCRDLRMQPFPAQSFEKVADIGIFEQVKFVDLAEYLCCMRQILVPGGMLLLHRITRSRHSPGPALRSLQPDLTFEPLAREMDIIESMDMEIVKIESLQRDYDFTLRNWIDGLRRNWASRTRTMTASQFDRGQRAWLLYLLETAMYLQSNDLKVHRMVLRRPAPICKAA